MSNTIANQKSQLAKLMATENIFVEHQKIRTAKFDPQNRVLYLPIWKDMNGDLYDHLTGHEVGHAIDTPADGWHDAVVKENKGKNYKNFLNVIEDARIEKRQKRRYPGLRLSFQKGFQNLMERDFFGLANRDINSMSFIDRLNVFTKSQYTADIEFSTQEKVFIEKVKNLETWSDVLRLTDEIYEYSKQEQFEMETQSTESFEPDPNGDEDAYDYDEDEFGEESDGDSQDSNKQSGDESDEESDEESGNKDESGEQSGDEENGERLNNRKDSAPSEKDQYNPKCETDENYRRMEDSLIDDKCKPYVYYDLPKPIMENLITPAKKVHKDLSLFFDSLTLEQTKVNRWIQEFKSKNDKFVNLLVKEFEMRKAAKSYSKSKISETGDIDINKLSNYKFDDNIFRKMMITPKGKNHGLVLLLDKSGSMSDNMAGSIEQILVLSMFCRKVNIPFVVYGFTNAFDVVAIDEDATVDNFERYHELMAKQYFEEKENNVALGMVRLREYLNSQMSNAEYSKAFRNMVLIKKSFEGGQWRGKEVSRPPTEALSNTPLNQAIYACGYVMNDFKKKYKLDLTSLVIVHDGESDSTNLFYEKSETTHRILTRGMNFMGLNVVIRDRKHKFEMKMEDRYNMNQILMNWFKHVTGSKIFGFFIAPKNRVSTAIHWYHRIDGKYIEDVYKKESTVIVNELKKQFNKTKLLICENPGFDGFFLIPGGDELETSQDKLEVNGSVTANKLHNAMMKMNKSKMTNRVLVTTFINKMAT